MGMLRLLNEVLDLDGDDDKLDISYMLKNYEASADINNGLCLNKMAMMCALRLMWILTGKGRLNR